MKLLLLLQRLQLFSFAWRPGTNVDSRWRSLRPLSPLPPLGDQRRLPFNFLPHVEVEPRVHVRSTAFGCGALPWDVRWNLSPMFWSMQGSPSQIVGRKRLLVVCDLKHTIIGLGLSFAGAFEVWPHQVSLLRDCLTPADQVSRRLSWTLQMSERRDLCRYGLSSRKQQDPLKLIV